MEPIIVALNLFLFLASYSLRILHVMALKGQAYSRRREVHPVAQRVALPIVCVSLPERLCG